MTQTSRDPGDIRDEYDRSEAFREDAMELLVETLWEDLPEHLQHLIGQWYAGTDDYEAVVEARVNEAREPVRPGDGDYIGEAKA
jgi:hypothetical protein